MRPVKVILSIGDTDDEVRDDLQILLSMSPENFTPHA